MRDMFGRRVDYLRLSITDRCNLRCVYCMPPEGVPLKPAGEILTYGEFLRCVRAAVSLGIRKVRVTGGEPLVRRGVVGFIRRLARIPGVEDLGMTTNGIGLSEAAEPLRQAGLGRINISLDTIRSERYAEITRRDRLPDVLSGIDAALRAGLRPVKINVVLLHGLHPGEVDDFLAMAREKPLEIRFIERMPMGCLPTEGYVSADRIRDRILSLPGCRRVESGVSSVAVTYEVPGFAGTLGIISPITRKFCSDCNRLRISADGRLRNCLFSRETIDLRPALRGGGGEAEVAGLFLRAVATKPDGHDLCAGGSSPEPMSRIGG
ncbi:MAG: GTP 3',8-cyclase MoaA [Deltaproteobacteria bacterium]|nr:GTP 3',8-cyclase MoaA [Deltaproteobacteria bacterium]PWB67339.1 MAG: GTP 3',8-cyclase MoaA [Deltaproteobacteria bacterium]